MLTEFIHSLTPHIFFWAFISARGSVRGFEATKKPAMPCTLRDPLREMQLTEKYPIMRAPYGWQALVYTSAYQRKSII